MAHDRPVVPPAHESGITRLVAAERRWRAALENAEAEAARLVDAARAANAEADAALDREIGALTAARTGEAERELRDRCAELLREADERAARYDGVGAERERAIAATIVERLWRAEPTSAGVAGASA